MKLIYDGDLGPDPCDFSTLSMLHEYHSEGMIDLVGVIGSTPDPYLPATLRTYNQLYGNNIPIGKSNIGSDGVDTEGRVRQVYSLAIEFSTYGNPNEAIHEAHHTNAERLLADVPGAVELYRELLSQAADDSLTIYAAGPLFNLPALLASQADRRSPLSGEQLLQKKVKEFVIMGGEFPASAVNPEHQPTAGAEYNWWALGEGDMTKSTIDALVKLAKPITYVGFEVGEEILVGREIVRRLGRDHPTSVGYYQYRATYESGHGPELTAENPAYDEVGLLYLAEGGLDTYFHRVSGSVEIDETGANTWSAGKGPEAYVTLRSGVADELAAVITDRVTGHTSPR